MLHKINRNFPKVRFTYIKLTQNLQTSQHTYLKKKTEINGNGNFLEERLKKLVIPSGKWINMKTSQKTF